MNDLDKQREALMRGHFESSIPGRIRRASSVRLQNIIPAHWFSAAASECAGMYIAGFFYGAISVSQAYVEALSKHLAEFHSVRVGKDAAERCRRLNSAGVISTAALNAAVNILTDRNGFHHLNKDVEQDYLTLEARAAECINLIHLLESEVFAFSIAEDKPGQLVLAKPEYWPSLGPDQTQVHLRQLW
jgi:hypothetical protein